MITHRECAVVVCDDCGTEVRDGQIPHWASESAARDDLADMGWDIYPDGQAICPGCTAERVCAGLGHSFLPPAECRCQGRIPAHRDGCTPWLNCARCGHCEPVSS